MLSCICDNICTVNSNYKHPYIESCIYCQKMERICCTNKIKTIKKTKINKMPEKHSEYSVLLVLEHRPWSGLDLNMCAMWNVNVVDSKIPRFQDLFSSWLATESLECNNQHSIKQQKMQIGIGFLWTLIHAWENTLYQYDYKF